MQGVTSNIHIGGLKYGAKNEGNKIVPKSECHVFSQ